MNKELQSLTGIRGIAALWVVCLHYFESINQNKDSYSNKLFSNGIVAVDVFFLLSAFVMCLAYSEEFKKAIPIHSYAVYLKKRFARIYPAYLFWILMFLSFDFIKFNFNYTQILLNVLLIQNLFYDFDIAGIFWSLCSEWFLYLIFPFLYAGFHKIKFNYVGILFIVGSLLGIYFLPSMNNYFIDFHKGIYTTPPSGFIGVVDGFNSILRCFFSYVIGINLFLLIRNFNGITYNGINILKYSALMGVFIICYFGKSAATYTLLIMCSIVLIFSLYFNREKTDSLFASKIIYFLGQISYSIYLCHMFILIFVSIVIKKLFPLQFGGVTQIYIVLGSLLLLVPVSYVSYRFIEVKMGGWLKSKLFATKIMTRDVQK